VRLSLSPDLRSAAQRPAGHARFGRQFRLYAPWRVRMAKVLWLDEPFGVGLLLLGCAAGAPFLPKLAQLQKVNFCLSGCFSTTQYVGVLVERTGKVCAVQYLLIGGHQISSPEPDRQRDLGVMKDRLRRHRNLVPTAGALPAFTNSAGRAPAPESAGRRNLQG
jgi:hypothetical protein